jgi:hypothetical protein
VFAVRFAALLALAVWTGGLAAPFWLSGGRTADVAGAARTLGYVCGTIQLLALIVIKLVGPPPRHFPVRAALAALMLAIVAAGDALHVASGAPMAIDFVLALILLSWYARE